MPRDKRLDLIGGVYHIISRGIERRKIFRDHKDKEEFLKRLNKALEETDTECFAWVLLDNHFHLLLRPLRTTIGQLMRKVLSGYVGYFNAKYRRVGHLFQNRYKSILCQEDRYLKELVRYIHLNPVRCNLIKTPTELKNYPFTGHKALMCGKGLCNQTIDEVLAYFGRTEGEARESYLKYIKLGWQINHKKEYSGGGLVRSAGGREGIQELKKEKTKWQSDYRILGDGDFVKNCFAEYDIKEDEKVIFQSKYTIERLINKITAIYELNEGELLSGKRIRRLTPGKSLFVYLGYEYLSISLKELGNLLKTNSASRLSSLKEIGEREFEIHKQKISITE